MAITYDPKKILGKLSSKKNLKKLVTKNLTVNRIALLAVKTSGILTSKKIEETTIKVIKQYKKSIKREVKEGQSKEEATKEVVNKNSLVVNRIENLAVIEIAKEIKRKYKGEYYFWLPSDAEVPDPLHQLNYGKKFKIGVGEMPGDRPGCKCGMRILVDKTKLDI